MTLEDASKERERLENDLRYYENRLDTLKGLILPQATQFDKVLVDGGKHTDNILKYVELENEQQLEITILYIKGKINDIDTWIDKEIKRLAKYGETIKAVVFLREKEFKIVYRNGKPKKIHLTWDEIASKIPCSEKTARNWYKLGIEERKRTRI